MGAKLLSTSFFQIDHIFLTARYPGTPPEYLRWNVENWPGAPRGGAAEITCLCKRLRTALAETAG
ncbi:MAG: hypothetical protein C5B60_08565 [Chloroflexi bacterium]|nr:MAG: hypothetical protein C5B60_08565 [Chloroflexota bacterium]